MACSVSIGNLLNGQTVDLPFEVNGTITVLPNAPAANLIAACKQIDDNTLQDIAGNCNPAPVTAGPSTFAFELSAADCPLPNTYYMLSIYCWDDQSTQVTLASVTFQTSGGPTPPPGPPLPPVPPGKI